MSEAELRAIRRRKIKELQRNFENKQTEEQTDKVNDDEVLSQIFCGRAWEVFNTANYQYPKATNRIKAILVNLALSDRLKEVTGEQLYIFLKKLGLEIRLNTKIRFTEHGKLKTLADKIKENW